MSEAKLNKRTYSTRSAAEYEVKEYYTWDELKQRNFNYSEKLGDPGQFPFTRGPFLEMYWKRPWIINCCAGYGSPEDCNRRFKKLLEYGAEGISVAVDLPTQMGLDSDHLLSVGQVGRVGVAIDSLRDMEILFEGIKIEKLSQVGMLGNSIGPIAFALFQALAEKGDLKETQWCINLQNDVIEEYATKGKQIFPMIPAIRIATDVVKYCAQKKLLHFKPMAVCGAHMSGAGTSWELAFAMSDAIVYIDHILSSGMGIDEFAPMLRLFLSIGFATIDLFEEVAKARAARRIWAKLIKERYGAKLNDSMRIRQTAFIKAGSTAQQPLNNVARIALGARAALLGGIESMHAASWDEALTFPSEEALQIAIRTQQILRHESGSFLNTADPCGGSYFLEDLTDRIEEQVLERMKIIENMGGALAAIEKGFYQQQISNGVHKIQDSISNGTRGQVGVNLYRENQDKTPPGKFNVDPEIERKKIEGLRGLIEERNNMKVKEALQIVRVTAETGDNLVPPILMAVKEYATIGEICNELKTVFGEYSEKRCILKNEEE